LSSMHAIYVLEGESQTGPFSPDEIRQAVADNRLTLSHLGWHEGCDGWKPLAEILSSGEAEAGDFVVLSEGPGYVLTSEALRVREEVFPLEEIVRATVEAEHTRRGRSIAATILFGVLVVVAVAMPHKPETTNQWMIWGLSLVVFLVLMLRFALAAFRPSATFLAVHLSNGDDRILPMSRREAGQASQAINSALEETRRSAEARRPGLSAEPSEGLPEQEPSEPESAGA
ncbi:MAG: DUF4339 domain-containing protein, partial [Terrimicrobiaceae bacterium]|nr:DUF4339 domain-containing protein [Terrimicrobiaceae bacterium]